MTGTDRGAPIERVTELFWLTDHHCWDRLETLFAERVRLDYTSLQGGDPVDLGPAEIVAGWKATLGPLDAHQHLVTNHLVTIEDGRAHLTASFQATHQFEGATWTLGGDYAFDLVDSERGWLIESMKMTAVWQTGDDQLLARAGERA